VGVTAMKLPGYILQYENAFCAQSVDANLVV
jgi:hypothetical protein